MADNPKAHKALIRSRGYRWYLKVRGSKATIDWEKVEREARYDGKYILRTNTTLLPAEVALAYKSLWQVERAFEADVEHLFADDASPKLPRDP
jgi:hypothetical protein